MENLHLLPTEKPSILYLNTKANQLCRSYSVTSQGGNVSNRHIYITSDEYIGLSYYLDGNLVRKGVVDDKEYWEVRKDYKKIILTTDQDLIKDGVQAIDDDFLEWFIKNPSCEEVMLWRFHGINTSIAEVNAISGDGSLNWQGRSDLRDYKIIIPQEEATIEDEYLKDELKKYDGIDVVVLNKPEEPKQETLEEVGMYQQELFNYLHDLGIIALQSEMQEIERIVLSMQQKIVMKDNETLEEYIEKSYPKDDSSYDFTVRSKVRNGIREGAKWQQEQILDFLYEEITERRDYFASKMCEKVIEFIEQFKKK